MGLLLFPVNFMKFIQNWHEKMKISTIMAKIGENCALYLNALIEHKSQNFAQKLRVQIGLPSVFESFNSISILNKNRIFDIWQLFPHFEKLQNADSGEISICISKRYVLSLPKYFWVFLYLFKVQFIFNWVWIEPIFCLYSLSL